MSDERPPNAGPAARTKRTKRRAAEVASKVAAAPGLPAFARAWPDDAELVTLVRAFEAGDYARVRRDAPDLAERTDDEAVRRAARELARRLEPDPVAVSMLAAAALLLAFLAGWYWSHPHVAPASAGAATEARSP